MTEELEAVFDKITVVAYLRSPQTRFLSSYQQGGLKTAGNRAPMTARPYMLVLSTWARFGPGGQLALHVFDRDQLIGGDVVEDFATRYTPEVLDEIRARPDPELNTSLSAEAMAVLEAMSTASKAWMERASRRLVAAARDHVAAGSDGAGLYPPPPPDDRGQRDDPAPDNGHPLAAA